MASGLPSEKHLKQTLKGTKYLHPGAAAKQILGSLEDSASFKTTVQEYTYPDGKKVLLMQLSLSVPVKSMDKQFNIPVKVWLPKAFPKEKPFVIISPTPNMALAAVNYVNTEGRVILPYLTDWKESRSDISTLLKMLEFKFNQACPVYQVRVATFSFGVPVPSTETGSSSSSRKGEGSLEAPSRFSIAGYNQGRETAALKEDLEKRDKEICSYKKTIETLSAELDELRCRVRDLEQAKRESACALAREREDSIVKKEEKYAVEELKKELSEQKSESEKLTSMLKEEEEKLQREIMEKEKVQARLDDRVSDLTQTRERIAILEVDNEDYHSRLQKTSKELKRSKTEFRELVGIKRNLKVKVSALETELAKMRARLNTDDYSQADSIRSFNPHVNELLHKIEDLEDAVEELESEKLNLVTQLEQFSQVVCMMEAENDALKSKLSSELLQGSGDESDKEESVVKCSISSSETQTETDSSEKETQSELAIGADRAIQVDTLKEVCLQYQRESELRSREVSILKEKLSLSSAAHKKQLKEAEEKIHQLLSFKEQLTLKNVELKKEIELLNPTDYQKTVNSAFFSIQELEQELLTMNKPNSNKGRNDDELKKALAEIEKLKADHAKEKLEMRQKVSNVVAKVKEREVSYVQEMNDLKKRLEAAEKRARGNAQLHAQANGGQNGLAGPPKLPENSIVSFRELESIGSNRLDEGVWGYVSETVFRGKGVAVRCLTRESLARFSIQEMHKQVSSLIHLRHPNIVLFLAASMDAPSGMMILTELLTCSLRQAYEARLIPNKLPVMLDIATAANFLHLQKKPLVHGCMTSQAVMVEEGPTGHWKAKLSNIGLSAPLMMLSEQDSVYQAPELSEESSKTASLPSDAYSFGVLLCELAINSLPKSTETLQGAIVDLKDALPQISFLIQSCLATSPEERPQMGTLVKKLKHLVANSIKMP